ncbi:MAG: putative metal-binding motif-containing protein, partial [Myxococcota bacterium]
MLLLFQFSTAALGQDILVPQNGTLQQAIDLANNGDVIGITDLKYGSTEIEPITVTINNKDLTIESAGGSLANHGINVLNGANVTLRNLLLEGNQPETDPSEVEIGNYCAGSNGIVGVQAQNSTVTMDNVEVTCFATGLVGTNATLNLTDSEFNANYPLGGIIATNGSLDVDDTEFSFNFAYQGGGIFSGATSTNITNSTFYANSGAGSDSSGAGLWVASETAYISSNEFANNFNLIWYLQGNPDPSNADLANLAGDSALIIGFGDGAGLYVRDPFNGTDADVEIHNNLFCGNLGNRGAGLFIDDVRNVLIRNNTFADDWSMSFGGGLYIKADEAWPAGDEAKVLNNTFLNNTAGTLPPPFIPVTTVIGGGGAAFFDGTVVDFRNNVVAYTPFGGGLAGIDGSDYTIGDFLTVDYNIFYNNCDTQNCTQPSEWQDFTGDLAQIALPATNLALDPFPTYFGAGEFVCIPDAFYPQWTSPAVRNGDPSLPNIYSAPSSDIGAYGGPEANVLDRDQDGIENIYDCNDDPATNGGGVQPGATETCDEVDNNCDGEIDEGFDTTWYIDSDADGFGDINQVQPLFACNPPANHVTNRDDCDDVDPNVNPGAAEICNGLDDNCNFLADDELGFLALYRDADNDLYGA